VKFLGGETTPREALRDGLRRNGLDVDRLEVEGRLCWSEAIDPAQELATALGQLLAETTHEGRQVWVSFNWTREVDLELMIAGRKLSCAGPRARVAG
jgi:hypothetical protein